MYGGCRTIHESRYVRKEKMRLWARNAPRLVGDDNTSLGGPRLNIPRAIAACSIRPSWLRVERAVDGGAHDAERERLGEHVVDQRVETVGALALVGITRHQQDGHGGMIARGRERQRNAVHD